MLYPSNFEQKVGFNQIRILLKECCIGSLGQSQVDEIVFLSDFSQILVLQEQVEEFRQILLFEPSFPSQNYFDIREKIIRLKVEGSCILVEDLGELRAVLQTIQSCLTFFRVNEEEEKYPRLQFLSKDVFVDNELVREINKLLDDKGKIRDTASLELQSIRQKIHKIEREIGQKFRKILHQAKQENLVESSAEMTVREGRLVIPLPAVNKRKIKGFIHDESSTGQTVFVEPQEIFELNNELTFLLLEEKREIFRLLKEFSDNLRLQIPDILLAFAYLAKIDFIRAKAKFALSIHAAMPIMAEKSVVCLKKARHPLLDIKLQKQQKSMVPITLNVGEDFDLLIISGPNAGGKSVCLKTIALLQYMFQCGLPVPASELSEFGVYEHLFIEIGDDQSIENELSTYSAHLKNIHELICLANEKTLFLIDELGSRTDPHYGAALAETILESLHQKKAHGVVSTHFNSLKMWAEQTSGVENAEMLFDEETLSPLFILKIGKHGNSFTFEIARKIGFSEKMLEQAIQKVGTTKIDYETLLNKLEHDKEKIDTQKRVIDMMDNQLAELIEDYQQKINKLKEEKYAILKNAKEESKTLIKDANTLIEKSIKEIKEAKGDKIVVKQIREKVSQFDEKLNKIKNPVSKVIPKQENRNIQIQDYVVLNDTNTTGQVVEIDGENIVVSFNSVQIKTTLDKISKTNNIPKKPKQTKISRNDFRAELNQNALNFKLQLNIRGMKADEAQIALERYLDDAILLSVHNVSILHGKGNGVLRMLVRDCLSKNSHVKSFHDERIECGGSGITVVELR